MSRLNGFSYFAINLLCENGLTLLEKTLDFLQMLRWFFFPSTFLYELAYPSIFVFTDFTPDIWISPFENLHGFQALPSSFAREHRRFFPTASISQSGESNNFMWSNWIVVVSTHFLLSSFVMSVVSFIYFWNIFISWNVVVCCSFPRFCKLYFFHLFVFLSLFFVFTFVLFRVFELAFFTEPQMSHLRERERKGAKSLSSSSVGEAKGKTRKLTEDRAENCRISLSSFESKRERWKRSSAVVLYHSAEEGEEGSHLGLVCFKVGTRSFFSRFLGCSFLSIRKRRSIKMTVEPKGALAWWITRYCCCLCCFLTSFCVPAPLRFCPFLHFPSISLAISLANFCFKHNSSSLLCSFFPFSLLPTCWILCLFPFYHHFSFSSRFITFSSCAIAVLSICSDFSSPLSLCFSLQTWNEHWISFLIFSQSSICTPEIVFWSLQNWFLCFHFLFSLFLARSLPLLILLVLVSTGPSSQINQPIIRWFSH